MKDFFVSYNKADRSWAVWIAWRLEEAQYSTVIEEWDFRAGCNFVLEMQNASVDCSRTIAVLSPDYLGARFTQSEWSAAFAEDPQGWQRKLVPVMVRDCHLRGLLAQVTYIDLRNLGEAQASQQLLLGVQEGRAKPSIPPSFPGTVKHSEAEKPAYPGKAVSPASPANRAREHSFNLFQRAYQFAVSEMQKSSFDSERFADTWVTRYKSEDFDRFKEAYSFAVKTMTKSAFDAERFAFKQVNPDKL